MNYKIEVKSEAESKESQELFVVLGYMVVNNIDCEKGYIVVSKNAESPINFDYWHDVKNIITLPQLRDLVVLKRNDVGDATHKGSITDNVYYVSSDEEVYRFESSTWCFSTVIVADLKPIEKPMKEYLNKLTDGTYKLVVLDSVADGVEGLIEIPEGAIKATLCNDFLIFWKDDFLSLSVRNGDTNFTFEEDEDYGFVEYMDINDDAVVIWQRHTHPEELPFVDDEPSLNDQYAEIEQVREEHKLKNDMNVVNIINSFCCADAKPNQTTINAMNEADTLCADTVNHPSHYASGEIECIDAIESSMTHEAFCGYLKGNVQKYMWRYENKGGLESLEKAQWYLNKLISRIG